MTAKVTFKIVRSFSLGFSVFAPLMNGFYVEFYLGCFHLVLWNRGRQWLAFDNYWSA